MANLTKARMTPELASATLSFGDPVAAATTLFEGSMVGLDASGNAVKAAPAVAQMRGVAKATVDNSDGVAGALTVETKKGVFHFAQTGLDRTDIETAVYVVDDNTVGATGTLIAGTLKQIDAQGAWVEIS